MKLTNGIRFAYYQPVLTSMTPLVLVSLNQWQSLTEPREKLQEAEFALSKCLDVNWSSWSEQVVGFDEGDNASHHFQFKKVRTTTRTSHICTLTIFFFIILGNIRQILRYGRRGRRMHGRGIAQHNSSVWPNGGLTYTLDARGFSILERRNTARRREKPLVQSFENFTSCPVWLTSKKSVIWCVHNLKISIFGSHGTFVLFTLMLNSKT